MSVPLLERPGGPAFHGERCNPFGHATDQGPKHLMGGMYGPRHEGPIKWFCEQKATARWRMTCTCDQTRHVPAPVMPLCPLHHKMISYRMSGACTTCLLPQENIYLANEYLSVQDTFHKAMLDGADETRLRSIVSRLNRIAEDIDAMTCHACLEPSPRPHAHEPGRPLAHKCRLTLVEVS